MDRTIPQTDDELRRVQARSGERSRPPGNVPGYEPERFLGEGAYGEVWVAIDQNTGCRVAIKFYSHRGGLDLSLLSREVEKLAFLFNDRYVTQLIEVGWNADPPYYVMEYLERGSLADRLRDGPMPVDEAIDMFRDVAQGLVHSHNKGVLHCDLKPANVLLDQDWRPRLADFGQSRLSSEQTPALGTLFYMAPEQADLRAVPDARWDVYALGCLLYCMLTGGPPFRDQASLTAIEKSTRVEEQLALYRKVIETSPTPKTHQKAPGVDRDLVEIVDRCLKIDPAKRFPNAQAVLDALSARATRRGRRPLIVLGALGPGLLMLLAAAFAWHSAQTALDDSHEALVRRAKVSNSFAARFVAENVQSQINRRWSILEQEAGDDELRQLLVAATGKPLHDERRKKLQTRLEELADEHPEIEFSGWSVMDATGVQLAREPFQSSSIDKNFAYRDYFHGQGRDLPSDSRKVKPLETVHLSNVFISTVDQEPKVAFSAPIWSGNEEDPNRYVIGVLYITVELARFADLHSNRDDRRQIAALVDGREDSKGKRGWILEHEFLTQWVANDKGTPPEFYLDATRISDLDDLRAKSKAEMDSSSDASLPHERKHASLEIREPIQSLMTDYQDPIGGEFEGDWIAAMQPVFVDGRKWDVADTGWGVIVQERFDDVIAPVRGLRERLVRQGLVALAAVLLVVSALWGFVAIVLNESPTSKFARWLRRRTGWAAPNIIGGTNSSNSRSGSARTENSP